MLFFLFKIYFCFSGKLFDVQLIENQLNARYEKTATIAIVSVAGLWPA